MRMGIRKNANLENYNNLRARWEQAAKDRLAHLQTKLNIPFGQPGAYTSMSMRRKAQAEHNELTNIVPNIRGSSGTNFSDHLTLGELGRYATSIGVDAYVVPNSVNGGYGDYWVILNRSALYVEDNNY